MNPAKVAQRLGITESRLESLQETVIKWSSWPEPRLLRFEKETSGIEAGTVIFENGEIVYGYPKIRRPLMLAPAIARHFSDMVAVEEKMNGHNVRVASINGDIVALTRGGFVCPYSTEVARRLVPEDLFDSHPHLVLCGEMIGPENPYVAKEIYPTDSIDFYLFDIAEKNAKGTFGVHRTHEAAESFGLKAAAFLGEFSKDVAAERIREIIIRLSRQGREGVVMKDPEGRVPPLKYTSSKTNCDFDYAGTMMEQMLLGLVAHRAGKRLEYDPASGRVTDSAEANDYLKRTYRPNWKLDG